MTLDAGQGALRGQGSPGYSYIVAICVRILQRWRINSRLIPAQLITQLWEIHPTTVGSSTQYVTEPTVTTALIHNSAMCVGSR